MQHYRDDHQRILELIAQQQWHALCHEDTGFIRAFVYSGFVKARAVLEHPGKTRLALTPRGSLYLAQLRTAEPPIYAEPVDWPRRRAEDSPSDIARSA